MSLELLKDNFYRFDKNTDLFEIDPPNRKVGNFHEEILKQAEYIYKNKTKDLYLFLSGGLDSEYMVHVFHSLNYKFTPVIARYHGTDDNDNPIIYNDHDNKYAFDICEKLGLTPLIIDLDFKAFIESGEMLEIAKSCGCWCPYRTPILKVCKIVSDTYDGCIFLANELYFLTPDLTYDSPDWKYNVDNIGKIWYHMIYAKLFAMIDFFKTNNIEGSPVFLGYSAETFLAFLLDPDIVKLANNGYPYHAMFHVNKGNIFNMYSNFNLEVYNYNTNTGTTKPNRIKLGGFEIFNNTKLAKHPSILEIHDRCRNKSYGSLKIDYFTLVKKLTVNQY